MNRINHLFEPNRLFLVWQRPLASSEPRPRRVVAEILSTGKGVTFRYLAGTDDFDKALAEGFKGFPAFNPDGHAGEYHEGVLEAFVRRLPPRKREDFSNYLAQYRLPEKFSGSDMAFLAYTGAKLPSDGFELVPDLIDSAPPLEFFLEVAGFRHQGIPSQAIAVDDPVRLVKEPGNPHDPMAITVEHALGRIGYLASPYCGAVSRWLESSSVETSIERINGNPERPLVYIFLKVT